MGDDAAFLARMSEPKYQSMPFPSARQTVIDTGRIGVRRHLSHALVEMDITDLRTWIHEQKAISGRSPSLTGWIVFCLAQAIQENPSVQAYRSWRNQLIIFDDADIVTMVEIEKDHVAIPHIIRSANQKSFAQIGLEIRDVKNQSIPSHQENRLTRLGNKAPGFFRRLFWWGLLKNPFWIKQMAGTAIVTSVGMFGQGGGWGVSFVPFHTLSILIGGISEKPGAIDGRIEIRQYLDLTVSFDHDIVDGAPAVRFLQSLKTNIEGDGYLDQPL